MKAKNITKLLLALSAFAFIFSACDKVEDATTAKIDVNDINLAFDASVEETQSASPASFTISEDASGMNKFSGSTVLNKEDEAFEDIKTYLNQIDEIEIANILFSIREKATEVQTYSAQNIVISAVGTNGYTKDVNIASYKFGESYTNDAKLIAFALSVVKQVKAGDTIALSIEGETDALEEDMLEVDLSMQGIKLLIELL